MTTTAPVHPGKILRQEIAARGLTMNALALKIKVPYSTIHDITRGQRVITPIMALRLAHCFGVNAEFFLNLQTNYKLAIARELYAEQIEREVETLS